jgi:predicted  nucleic acid-binding Zn-ribbon protein
MAVSPPMNTKQQGLGQLMVNADRKLVSIQASIEEAEATLVARQAELESIAARQAARNQQLQIAAESVSTTRSELESARLKIKLAEGTLAGGEEDSIKTLEKRLLKLEADEQNLRTRLIKEAASDTQKAAAAQTAIDQAQELLTLLQKEFETTRQARNSAFNDLGAAKKQEVLNRLKDLHENISSTRAQAASAVQALDRYADVAISTLHGWPALQAQLQPFLPAYVDASTQLLEAQVSLLSVLLNNGKLAQMDSDLVQQVLQSKFASMNQLLELSDRDLWQVFGIGDLAGLREKRAQVEKLLSAYRMSKSKVG